MTDDPDPAPHPHLAHNLVTYQDGVLQVQHIGEGHVVPGSEQIIDVFAGTTLVIRHVRVTT